MIFQCEKFSRAFFDEVVPLFHQHYDEIAEDKAVIGPLDVNVDAYIKGSNADVLALITARDAGTLAGYIMAWVTPSLHYRTCLTAKLDIYYVAPGYRKRGLGRSVGNALFVYFEDEMRSRGVKIIHLGYKAKHDHGDFFTSLGYRPFERWVTKTLE